MSTIITGDASFVSNSLSRSISNATNATPIVVGTTVPHLYGNGDRVQIVGVTGNTGANGLFYITVTDATHFKLNGSVGTGAYTGPSGTAVDISLTPQFTIPSDADPFNAAAWNVAIEALADRTQFLAGVVIPSFYSIRLMSGVGSLVYSDVTIYLTGNPWSLQLPNPATCKGRRYYLIDKSNTLSLANPITLVRFGAENIDNAAADYTLCTAFGRWILTCDGVDWYVETVGEVYAKSGRTATIESGAILQVIGTVNTTNVPNFITAKTLTRTISMNKGLGSAAITRSLTGVFTGPLAAGILVTGGVMAFQSASSSNLSIGYSVSIDEYLVDGSTLIEVDWSVKRASSDGTAPNHPVAISIMRRLWVNATPTIMTSASFFVEDSFGASIAQHTVVTTVDQNNVIDKSQYTYTIIFWNEMGDVHVQSGLAVYGALLKMNAIADMRTP